MPVINADRYITIYKFYTILTFWRNKFQVVYSFCGTLVTLMIL